MVVYGDGAMFHWDYYNSFVIQPMYVDLVRLFENEHEEIRQMKSVILKRAARYASELERMIGPEGSYPIIGRSICYRFGAFQMLSQAALEHMLEPHISPASVRCGLSAVITRVMSSPDLFDEMDGCDQVYLVISRNWQRNTLILEAYTCAARYFFHSD